MHDRIPISLLELSSRNFPQDVYCSWGDAHDRSVYLKSINGLLNHYSLCELTSAANL